MSAAPGTGHPRSGPPRSRGDRPDTGAERPTRRGRPPKSDGQETAARLLDAAAAACAEQGFDGATLGEITRRAGLTSTAVYNHFDSREALLYAAGERSLRAITESVPAGAGTDAPRLIALAYLQPDLAQTRRLLAELHTASQRDPNLAVLLAEWHQTWAAAVGAILPPDDPAPTATAKAFFLLLLGLCHLEDLSTLQAPNAALTARVQRAVDALISAR